MKRDIAIPLSFVLALALTATLALHPRPAPGQPGVSAPTALPTRVLDRDLVKLDTLAEIEWQVPDAADGRLGEAVAQFNVARYRQPADPLSGPSAFTAADEWYGTAGANDDITAGGRYGADSEAVAAFIKGLSKLDLKKVSDTQNRQLTAMPHASLRVILLPVAGTEPLGRQMAGNVLNVLFQVFKQRREPTIDMVFATLGRYVGDLSPAALGAAIDMANEENEGDIEVIADDGGPAVVEMMVGGELQRVSALSTALTNATLDERATAARETAASAVTNGAAITAARTTYVEALQRKQALQPDQPDYATAARNAARLRALWKAELFQATVIEVIESKALGNGVRTGEPWVLVITTAGGALPTIFAAPDDVVDRLVLVADDVLELPKIMTPEDKPEPKIVGDDENPIVVMRTTMGEIRMELWQDAMANTVANMIELIEANFYDGLRFHRVIDGFMIQGGCPTTREGVGPRAGTSDAGYKFRDEGNDGRRFDRKGLLAMANSGPNTNGSQFFVTLVSTPHLDDAPGRHYSMFGEVIDGLDVVDAIGKVDTNQRDQPLEEVIILGMWVEQKRDGEYTVERMR